MAKWKIFGRSKSKEQNIETIQIDEEESQETTHIYADEQETAEETHDPNKPLVEYDETLQTSKKTLTIVEEDGEEGYIDNESAHDQRVWRDIKKIEKNIDNIHITQAQKPKTNVEKTVDELVEKRKKKKK